MRVTTLFIQVAHRQAYTKAKISNLKARFDQIMVDLPQVRTWHSHPKTTFYLLAHSLSHPLQVLTHKKNWSKINQPFQWVQLRLWSSQFMKKVEIDRILTARLAFHTNGPTKNQAKSEWTTMGSRKKRKPNHNFKQGKQMQS